MKRDATMSACGRYRYLLRRTWDYTRRQMLFIMLNPSTADAAIDDATIRSCIRLCTARGDGGFEVVNLFGWRATNPKELLTANDPVGLQNDGFAEVAINRCDAVICAWGANKVTGLHNRAQQMLDLVLSRRPAAYCLGITKGGHPKHPLYLKTETPILLYER